MLIININWKSINNYVIHFNLTLIFQESLRLFNSLLFNDEGKKTSEEQVF